MFVLPVLYGLLVNPAPPDPNNGVDVVYVTQFVVEAPRVWPTVTVTVSGVPATVVEHILPSTSPPASPGAIPFPYNYSPAPARPLDNLPIGFPLTIHQLTEKRWSILDVVGFFTAVFSAMAVAWWAVLNAGDSGRLISWVTYEMREKRRMIKKDMRCAEGRVFYRTLAFLYTAWLAEYLTSWSGGYFTLGMIICYFVAFILCGRAYYQRHDIKTFAGTMWASVWAFTKDMAVVAWNFLCRVIEWRIYTWKKVPYHTRDVYMLFMKYALDLEMDDSAWPDYLELWTLVFKHMRTSVCVAWASTNRINHLILGVFYIAAKLFLAYWARALHVLNHRRDRTKLGQKVKNPTTSQDRWLNALIETSRMSWDTTAELVLTLEEREKKIERLEEQIATGVAPPPRTIQPTIQPRFEYYGVPSVPHGWNDRRGFVREGQDGPWKLRPLPAYRPIVVAPPEPQKEKEPDYSAKWWDDYYDRLDAPFKKEEEKTIIFT
ncbi:epidermal growth factor-like type 3 [Pyrenophora seminiperda CCB06]|uniref:Epidermal growth factor-like type 3 n=1 Tax=Pyrenophora seminiperda CCB06 TaxID=1302712 RepID=A0A3M7MCK8_9PLEO|nr:epidermal growth factor-like type 3 [Pyrenophora seminiperda CCB06]